MLSEAALRGRDVLAIQGTTVLRSTGGGGDYLHVAAAVDEVDGAILGLVDGRFLQRSSGRAAGGSGGEKGELPLARKRRTGSLGLCGRRADHDHR